MVPVTSRDKAAGPPKGRLPYVPVAILSLSYGVLSYTLTNLFAYVGFMAQHVLQLSDKNEVGFYAGFIASSFTFGRFLTGYPWGYTADVIGRKPVMVIGLVSTVVFSTAFGLSSTFTMAMLSRFLLGITNGMVCAIRTSVRELCGPEHVVLGMTFIGGATGAGVVFGASAGGLLAQPALYYPEVFSSTGLFATYPFLLPNLCGASLALLTLPLVIFFVPETKDFDKQNVEREASSEAPSEVNDDFPDDCPPHAEDRSLKKRGVNSKPGFERLESTAPVRASENESGDGVAGASSRGANGSTGGDSDQDVGLWGGDGLLATPYVKLFLFLACAMQYTKIGYHEAYPLWALSTEDVGGLNWGTKRIGEVLGVSGLLMAMGNLFVVPKLIEKIGLANWNRGGCVFFVLASIAVPSAKLLSWNDASLFAVSTATDTILFFSQGAILIALTVGTTSVVPSHKRGKLSGLFNTAESLGRCAGSASFSVMYAWSISPHAFYLVDYHFVFYLSAAIMTVVTILSWNTLTSEILTKPAERNDAAGVPTAAAGGDMPKVEDSFVSSPRTASREADIV